MYRLEMDMRLPANKCAAANRRRASLLFEERQSAGSFYASPFTPSAFAEVGS